MKTVRHIGSVTVLGVGLLSLAWCAGVYAQTSVPSTFKHITVDGAFDDWTGVPLAYTAPAGPDNAIQYENVYVANDENNLYIRFTLYSPRPNAFANSFDNIFIDADNSAATGFAVGGIGSEMLVQWGGGYQEKNGGFNEGAVNNLGWAFAGSADSLDFELAISRGATYASDNSLVFTNDTIAIVLEGDDTSYASVEFVATGGLIYTFASPPEVLSNNLPLVTLTSSSWQVNGSGTDLGTNWLDPNYDDTQAGWSSGPGLFGYTPSPGAYPPIQTALSSGPNTYYFRTHFNWNNLPDNVAFVVTNYLSDGAVFYLNGVEVNRVRMPVGMVDYSTAATGTNSPVGQYSLFGFPGTAFALGDNLLEVETHQAPASGADMVFGMSLTAAARYPIVILDPSQPADRAVNGGDATTFTASLLGSGPLSYQWLFNSNSIPGATNASYTIPQVLYTNAGSYALRVSNPLSTNTTRAAVLTVTNTPVTFADSSQPADVVAVEGRAVTLTSVVAGSPPFVYQWYFGASPIPGATNSAYTIPASAPTDTGVYQVKVSNQANSTNSRIAAVTILADTLPPTITGISAGSTRLVVDFSEPLDALSATNPANYSVSGGVSVTGAAMSPGNPNQVILTTSGLNLGALYTVSVNGVKDLFGNAAVTAGGFTRGITIDGDFSDWDGLAPIYTSDTSGTPGAADFKAVYAFNDANNYYFRVTLWQDIPASAGQFPLYANIYYDTDDDVNTGHLPGTIGSELLTQSGFGYQEKNGAFNEGGINGLGWSCLPATTNSDFEFSISRGATYASDGLPVFTTNVLNVHFEGQTTSFAAVNEAPPVGVMSYTNVDIVVPPLPVSLLAASLVPGNRVAVTWEGTGTLQAKGSLSSVTWTNVPAATSPYVSPAVPGPRFFRLSQ
jgi:Immunoglobulin domain